MRYPTLAIGDTVQIVDGISTGKVGVVSAKWKRDFAVGKGVVPMWVVELGGVLAGRVVRADFLKLVTNEEKEAS